MDDHVWGWDVNWDREEKDPTMISVVGVLSELETVPSGGWVKRTGSRHVVLSAGFTPGLAVTIPSPHATLTFEEEQAQT